MLHCTCYRTYHGDQSFQLQDGFTAIVLRFDSILRQGKCHINQIADDCIQDAHRFTASN